MILLDTPSHGDTIDAAETMYPSDLTVVGALYDETDTTSAVYGYVISGRFESEIDGISCGLDAGTYFAASGRVRLDPSHIGAVAVVIRRYGYRVLTQIGRIESKGRLSYIDGCSDTLLCAPARLGDACLNYLHFPPTIVQTQHTHPSIRLGIVARGRGMAFGPGWERPLEPGMVFMLEEQELHSFRTDRGMRRATPDELAAGVKPWVEDATLPVSGMDIIAFHPDSDWGPTDQTHPMLNRTYIGTTPASGGQGI